jgi:hypothetical protein
MAPHHMAPGGGAPAHAAVTVPVRIGPLTTREFFTFFLGLVTSSTLCSHGATSSTLCSHRRHVINPLLSWRHVSVPFDLVDSAIWLTALLEDTATVRWFCWRKMPVTCWGVHDTCL